MPLSISSVSSHPVIFLPPETPVLDMTYVSDRHPITTEYAIGRYNEKRTGVYTKEIFGGVRNIHMGIDIFAPVGTPIYAFADGQIYGAAFHQAVGDYGYTLITQRQTHNGWLFALYGHLSAASTEGKALGQLIKAGEMIGEVGDRHENGDWHPHLHFQLSTMEPSGGCDLPGVVSEEQHAHALTIYPDPRLVLGAIY